MYINAYVHFYDFTYVYNHRHVYKNVYKVHMHVGVADKDEHEQIESGVGPISAAVVRFWRLRYQIKAKNVTFLMKYELLL